MADPRPLDILSEALTPVAATPAEVQGPAKNIRARVDNWQPLLEELKQQRQDRLTFEDVKKTTEVVGTERDPATGAKKLEPDELARQKEIEKQGNNLVKLLARQLSMIPPAEVTYYVNLIRSEALSDPVKQINFAKLSPTEQTTEVIRLLQNREFLDLFVRRSAKGIFTEEGAKIEDKVSPIRENLRLAEIDFKEQKQKVGDIDTEITTVATEQARYKKPTTPPPAKPPATATPGEKLSYYEKELPKLQQERNDKTAVVEQKQQALKDLEEELQMSKRAGGERPKVRDYKTLSQQKRALEYQKTVTTDKTLLTNIDKQILDIDAESVNLATYGPGPEIRDEVTIKTALQTAKVELTTAQKELRVVQDQLDEKDSLEKTQKDLEDEKKDLEEKKKLAEVERQKRELKVNTLKQQLADAQSERASLEDTLVHGCKNVVAEAYKEYLDRDVGRLVKALEEENQALAKQKTETDTQMVIDAKTFVRESFNGKYMVTEQVGHLWWKRDRPAFDKPEIESDFQTLFAQGPDKFIKDALTGKAGIDINELMKNQEFMNDMTKAVREQILSRYALTKGFNPALMFQINHQSWGKGAIGESLEEVKTYIKDIKTAQEAGVLASDATFSEKYKFYFKKHPYSLGGLIIGAAMLAAFAKPKSEEEAQLIRMAA